MAKNLLQFLKHENKLLIDMLDVADEQKKALIKYDVYEIENLAKKQESISKNLQLAEGERINYFVDWLGISKQEAVNLNLSTIERKINPDLGVEVRKMRDSIRELTEKIEDSNSMNRVLANRARHSVREILSVISNNDNHVFNVKI